MSRFDKALQSLQPNFKDIVRTFLFDTNFGDHEYRRYMIISFTTPADEKLGYRRLELNTYKDGRIPALFHDTDVVEFKKDNPPSVPLAYDSTNDVSTEQTFENVMNLIDSTTIKHILDIRVTKYHAESDMIYDWRELSDLAKEASRDKTTHHIK
jgi:hypothetical protein